MKKRTQIIVAMLLIAACSFSYGVLAAKFRIPPYSVLNKIADSPTGQRLSIWVTHRLNSDTDGQGSAPLGNWNPARRSSAEDLSREDLVRLEALGYLDGTQLAPGQSGVVTLDQTLAEGSVNLYSSGHTQAAVLMDSEGRILHTWSRDFLKLIDKTTLRERDGRLARLDTPVWRRVQVLDNGDLLAVYSGIGIAKLDKNSEIIWFNDEPVHHDFSIDWEQGLIYALSRQERMVPRISSVRPVIDDFVVTIDLEGKTRNRISLLDAIENSDYRTLLSYLPDQADIFHANSIEVLEIPPERESAPFNNGDLLISIRHLDAVVALDFKLEKVVWVQTALWRWQHDPTLLDNGNLLVFDNRRDSEYSRVLELNPLTQKIVWMYEGNPSNGFFTATCGVAQRLENGNTLITESDAGRAFEVTPDGSVVWDFLNPARAGENEDLIATLFEVKRLPKATELRWLED